jgi:hypothetical protein
MAALPLGSPSSVLAFEKSEFILVLALSHPTVPGLHPPDKPGTLLFQDLVALNQTQPPYSDKTLASIRMWRNQSWLQLVAPYIKSGIVLFPGSRCEQLLGQIFELGVKSHDDLD